MKVKIDFTILTNCGEGQENVVIEMTCPDFVEKKQKGTFGVNVTTVEEQIVRWLDEQDKTSLMYEHDIYTIISYKVYKPEIVVMKEISAEVFKGMDKQKMIDFFAIYKRMEHSLRGITAIRKFEIVLTVMGIAQDAQAEILRRVNIMLENPDRNYNVIKGKFEDIKPKKLS